MGVAGLVAQLARGLTALRRRFVPDSLAIALYVLMLGAILGRAFGQL